MSQKLKIKSKLSDTELDLSATNLKDVPVKELAALPKATQIDLSCNRLTCIPESFCDLTHIVRLDLGKNQIKELPDNFGNLKNLQYLDLFSNQLKILPESFHQLVKLKWLDVKDNPLDPDLKAVAGECVSAENCRLSAKKVVAFMSQVHGKLEEEREKRRQKQQKKAASKKAKEEARQDMLKQEKKAAKEKRRAEVLQQQEQQKVKDQKKVKNEKQPQKPKNDKKSNDIPKKEKIKNDKSKLVLKKSTKTSNCWSWLLAVIILVISVLIGIYLATNMSDEDFQKVTTSAANVISEFAKSSYVLGKQITFQVTQSLSNTFEYVNELWQKRN